MLTAAAARTAALVLVLACGAVVAPATATPAGVVTAPRAGALQLDPSTPLLGEPLAVSAVVPGPARRPVTLQVRAGGAWRTVARGRAARSGRTTLTAPAPRGTIRLAAPAAGGRPAWTSSPRAVPMARPRSRVVDRAGGGGLPADGANDLEVSADGRWAVWVSASDDIANVDTNGTADVYLTDLRTGATTLVSRTPTFTAGNGTSIEPSISADGAEVAFSSAATDLVPGPSSGYQVYRFSRATGTVTRVSNAMGGGAADGVSSSPAISADGSAIAFTSSATTMAGDTTATVDVFIGYRGDPQPRQVSITPSGVPGSARSESPSISATGRYVSFSSNASDLVAGDTDGFSDVFVRDLDTSRTTLISRVPGGPLANGASYASSISGAGDRVAFETTATNLATGGSRVNGDVVVWTRGAPRLVTASVRRDPAAAFAVDDPHLSRDGRWVLMDTTDALLAADRNGVPDTYAVRLGTGSGAAARPFLVNATVSSTGRPCATPVGSSGTSISGDGRFVGFVSYCSDLTPGDTNTDPDVFLTDLRAR
ncbi:hypothetical protein [Nocardioides sp.]|uniref:hypothetical protein n=1 Tax=Nocardioides sp. TaxID=35761 RepID=UPI003514EC7D